MLFEFCKKNNEGSFCYDVDDVNAKYETIRLVCEDYFKELMATLNREQLVLLLSGIHNLTDDNDDWGKLYDYYNDRIVEKFREEALIWESQYD